ncbi:NAD(P)-binding domain-containing protein [Nesterenkonia sp. CL21]|uniref:RraA family protein n=1 Tax=Nesterenkonia sp. CL21 TaxID=3064894 RepID=UPI00287B1760|nr:NAD(P)-binding domain-containing protein [Nesterenkonia sp. CL21]MDS2172972.1 NAD(P)-binding domain-containing protein [Nesterenkonia sp. CL21]
MTVAVLGLGEAGQVFARAFAQAGDHVVGFDPGPARTPDGVVRADTAAEAVAEAEMVLSLTTARFAVAAAEQCRAALSPGVLYLDLNASSPEVKKSVETVLEGAAQVVDGAVIGSVRAFGATVQVLLSGAASGEVEQQLSRVGTRTEILGAQVGDASRRKLLRSIFMKGLSALVQESLEAAAGAGDEQWVRQQMAEALVGGESTVDRLDSGIRIHARRRSQELADSLELIQDLEGTWPMTWGARERHLLLARRAEDVSPALEVLRRTPTAALGDGSDRLGFVGADLRPVWDCPQIAGPALTVQTQAGDNFAIHQALARVKPGQILVVSGERGRERALIGDLIAERAKKAGVAGMILDAPVRDAAGIAEVGLPVWAAGVSAAGPYKSGPARLGRPVAVGHAVCNPGDIVVADAEGILFLPPEEATAAAEAAEAVLAEESARRESIRSTA